MMNIVFTYNNVEYITLYDIAYRQESIIPTSYLPTQELQALMLTVDRNAEILEIRNRGTALDPDFIVKANIGDEQYEVITSNKENMFRYLGHINKEPEVREEEEASWIEDLEQTSTVETKEDLSTPMTPEVDSTPKWMRDIEEVAEQTTEPEQEQEQEHLPDINPLYLRHIDAYTLDELPAELTDDYCRKHGWHEMDGIYMIDDVINAMRRIHSDSMNIDETINYAEVAKYNARHQ